MKIKGSSSTESTVKEIGERLLKQRLGANLTQAALAEKAGVSKRTIERIESGCSIQLSTLIQVLRVFDLLNLLDQAIPAKPHKATSEEKAVTHTAKRMNRAPEETPRKSRSWGFEERPR